MSLSFIIKVILIILLLLLVDDSTFPIDQLRPNQRVRCVQIPDVRVERPGGIGFLDHHNIEVKSNTSLINGLFYSFCRSV